MRAEIITIGDELCRGDIVDTNAGWLARELWNLDIIVAWMTSCRDVGGDIEHVLDSATRRADLVLVSGGLGPTEDDITVNILSKLLNVQPILDESALAFMKRRFAEAGYKLTDNNLRQVQVPAGSLVLANPTGLAPAFEVSLNTVPVICMPGVPREMREIFRQHVAERAISMRIARGEQIECIAKRTLRVFGTGESHVETMLAGLLDGVTGASVHYRVPFPEVLVQIVIRDREQATADRRLQEVLTDARDRLGWRAYGEGEESLAAVLGRALERRGMTMATAESCTGGMVGAYMTEVPGSSAYFLGGAITYSNDEKMRQLDVPASVLAEHGAVSQACVEAMARGICARSGADFGVAISGIAGPGGGTADKPVGTVWIAVGGPRGMTSQRRQWPGTRDQVRRRAAFWAMSSTLRAVEIAAADGESR